MTSSVIPSLKKSWPASPDRFLNGSTATDGRRRDGPERRGSRHRPAWRERRAPAALGLRPSKVPRRPGRRQPARDPAAATRVAGVSLDEARGRDAHRIGANRLGDVLDAMAAERTVIEIELVPDLVVDGLRDADRAGLGERLEPRGDVDAIAKDVVAVDDDVAEIDADPQFETALGGIGSLIARAACCISTAQLNASTTLEKSASRLSPAVPTIRPPCAAISGSTARRSSPSA